MYAHVGQACVLMWTNCTLCTHVAVYVCVCVCVCVSVHACMLAKTSLAPVTAPVYRTLHGPRRHYPVATRDTIHDTPRRTRRGPAQRSLEL